MAADDSSLFTSESVAEGHPDKVADQISDAILDAILARDPQARVACECLITTGLVTVAGEITTSAEIDVEQVVRQTIAAIGYTDAALGFDAARAEVRVALDPQSPEIAQGVAQGLEARSGASADAYDACGAGDQGMMFGFACDETPELLPLPIALAHRLTRRLTEVRHAGEMPWLRPDGKAQVTVRYAADGRPLRVETVVLAAQHDPSFDGVELAGSALLVDRLVEQVIRPALGAWWHDGITLLVNPTGAFVQGGPQADAGLTGRKIIVDSYGGMARHGGGAFSGKDPTKVDRSAAYAARWLAKHVVAAVLARRCEIQVAYAIGVARPVSLRVETFGTEAIERSRIEQALGEVFDLRPAAIIQELGLRAPIYRQTACGGHFGRPELDLPWERTERVEALRAAARRSLPL